MKLCIYLLFLFATTISAQLISNNKKPTLVTESIEHKVYVKDGANSDTLLVYPLGKQVKIDSMTASSNITLPSDSNIVADSNSTFSDTTTVGDWELVGNDTLYVDGDSTLLYSNISQELNPNPYFDDWSYVNSLTNSTFTGGTSGWTMQAGWAYNSNNVTHTPGAASYLLQSSSLTVGKTYRVTFTISNMTQGTFGPNSAFWSTDAQKTSNGTYEYVGTTNNANFYLYSSADFDGTLDDVYAEELVAPDGWTASTMDEDNYVIQDDDGLRLVSDGTNVYFQCASVTTVGKQYVRKLRVTVNSGGGVKEQGIYNPVLSATSTGTYIDTVTASGTGASIGRVAATETIIHEFSLTEYHETNNISLSVETEEDEWYQLSYDIKEGETDLLNGLGDCTTDFADFKGTGWSYDAVNDEYDCDGSQIASTQLRENSVVSSPINKWYYFTFEVKNYSSGTLYFHVGGYDAGTAVSANGVYSGSYQVTNASSNNNVYWTGNTDFEGSVTDMKVYELDSESQSIGSKVYAYYNDVLIDSSEALTSEFATNTVDFQGTGDDTLKFALSDTAKAKFDNIQVTRLMDKKTLAYGDTFKIPITLDVNSIGYFNESITFYNNGINRNHTTNITYSVQASPTTIEPPSNLIAVSNNINGINLSWTGVSELDTIINKYYDFSQSAQINDFTPTHDDATEISIEAGQFRIFDNNLATSYPGGFIKLAVQSDKTYRISGDGEISTANSFGFHITNNEGTQTYTSPSSSYNRATDGEVGIIIENPQTDSLMIKLQAHTADGEDAYFNWFLIEETVPSIDGYEIWKQLFFAGTADEEFNLLTTVSSTTTSYTHQVSDGDQYAYKVRAHKGSEYSAFTDPDTAKFEYESSGTAPILTITDSTDQMIVSISKIQTHVKVWRYYDDDSTRVLVYSGTASTFSDSVLVAEENANYIATGHNAGSGETDTSSVVKADLTYTGNVIKVASSGGDYSTISSLNGLTLADYKVLFKSGETFDDTYLNLTSTDDPVLFNTYGGSTKAIIGSKTSTSWEIVVVGSYVNGIDFYNLTFYGSNHSNSGGGISLNYCGEINIINCKFEGGNSSRQSSKGAMYISGKLSGYNKISNNDISGFSEGIKVQGMADLSGIDSCIISYNYIYDCYSTNSTSMDGIRVNGTGEIHNNDGGPSADYQQRLIVTRNEVTGWQEEAIDLAYASNVICTWNDLHDNHNGAYVDDIPGGFKVGAQYTWDSSGTTLSYNGSVGNVFRYNKIYNITGGTLRNTGFNIENIMDFDISYNLVYNIGGPNGKAFRYSNSNQYDTDGNYERKIYNNTFESDSYIGDFTTGSPTRPIYFYNNICILTTSTNYGWRHGYAPLYIGDNLWVNRNGYAVSTSNTLAYSLAGSLSYITDQGGDIYMQSGMFADSTNNDFSLTTGSPAINAGRSLSGDYVQSHDILGNPIVGTPDMGCYEKQ